MEQLDRVTALNGVSVLSTSGNDVIVTQYSEKITLIGGSTNANLALNGDESKETVIPNIKEVLDEFKGKRNCIINSDIFNVINEKVKIKNLESHTIKRILVKIIEESIPYLTEVSVLEGSDILIQVVHDNDNPALTITVGLMDDIQVLLLDIHYERNERSIKC